MMLKLMKDNGDTVNVYVVSSSDHIYTGTIHHVGNDHLVMTPEEGKYGVPQYLFTKL